MWIKICIQGNFCAYASVTMKFGYIYRRPERCVTDVDFASRTYLGPENS
jgi:hypothetical protein